MQDVEPLEARQREGHRLRLRYKRRRIERQRSDESAAAQLRQLRCRNEPQRDGAVLRKGVFREIEHPGEARQVVEREVAADGRETRQQGAEIGDGGQRSQPHVAREPFDKRQVDRFDGRTPLDGERPGRGKPRQRDRPKRRTVGQLDRPDGFDQRKLARRGQRKLLVGDRPDRSQRTEGRRELSQPAEAYHGQLPADTLQFGENTSARTAPWPRCPSTPRAACRRRPPPIRRPRSRRARPNRPRRPRRRAATPRKRPPAPPHRRVADRPPPRAGAGSSIRFNVSCGAPALPMRSDSHRRNPASPARSSPR